MTKAKDMNLHKTQENITQNQMNIYITSRLI